MGWISEFGREYEIPGIVDWMARQGVVEDISWHNDVMPSFALTDPADDGYGVRIWIDHPIRLMRETGASNRFTVQEGPLISESDFERSTDDLQDALGFFFERALRPRYRTHPFRGLPWVMSEAPATSAAEEWSPHGDAAAAVVEQMVNAWSRSRRA